MKMMTQYFEKVTEHLALLFNEEGPAIQKAARMVADQVKENKIVYAYGPGGHSNLRH